MTNKNAVYIILALVAMLIGYLVYEFAQFGSSTKLEIRNLSKSTLTEVRLEFGSGSQGKDEISVQEIANLPLGGNHSQRLLQKDAYLQVRYKRGNTATVLDCGYIESSWDTYLITVREDDSLSKCELLTIGSGPGPS